MNKVDDFLAEYPEESADRLVFVENRLGMKREWFKLLLEVEGGDFSKILSMSPSEIFKNYYDRAEGWLDICIKCLENVQYDIDAFNAISEKKKLNLAIFFVQPWIQEKLFEQWQVKIGIR